MYWYEQAGDTVSPVLSTRVRFARNLKETPFPARLDEAGRVKVFEAIRTALAERDRTFVDFGEVSPVVKNAYVQTHLASAALAECGKGSGLALSKDGKVAVMINEEDHVRLQTIYPGKAIRAAFETALDWESFLESRLAVANREPYGYLTSCPTNLGSAMRISAMMHLPALQATRRISALSKALSSAGITVRGMFGEGSRADGCIYQLSNQSSRESTPEEIVASFEKVLERVELEETKAREALLDGNRLAVKDEICRALGAMRYSRRMPYSEFLTLYSRVRFGREIGLEETAGIRGLDRLLIELSPAPMILRQADLADETSRDSERSRILREALSE